MIRRVFTDGRLGPRYRRVMELVIAGTVILVPLLIVAIVLAVVPVRRAASDRHN